MPVLWAFDGTEPLRVISARGLMNCVCRYWGRVEQARIVLSSRQLAGGRFARWFEPRETQDLRACADTRRDGGWSCGFMRRTRPMVENGAGVELRRAVLGDALLRRTEDNSRTSEHGQLQAMLLQLRWFLNL